MQRKEGKQGWAVPMSDRASASPAAGEPAEPYRLYALRFAHHISRRSLVFLGGDANDGPLAFDYFVWLAVGNDRTILIDTGFKKSVADRRGREWFRCPSEAIEMLDVTADQVTDVVVSHLHFDHAGNLDKFPNAKFHIQDSEMQFATGRHMGIAHPCFATSFEDEDVVQMVEHVFAGRAEFHDGDARVAPGFELLQVPGHTPGSQMARVWTRRGWVLLVADAVHFYANINEGRPFYLLYDVAAVFESYRRIRAVAESPDHIIPGHDPLVMEQYPTPSSNLEGCVVQLDVPPRFSAVVEATTY